MHMGKNIGFIGTGVITSALVTGFCSGNDLDHKFFLSPRNAERASSLASQFNNVTVCGSNQEVLDQSEWVFLAVVPKLGEEILSSLTFREDHQVINLMSDRKLPEIAGWIGKTSILAHAVPLPFAARRIGPVAIYPDLQGVRELLSPLGEIVGVDDVRQIEALAAITGLMSSYYALLLEVANWGEREGLSKKAATSYTTAFFEALSCQVHYADETELERRVEEMTPGGLNEMALLAIREQNGFEMWARTLDPIIKRLRRQPKD